MRFSERPQVAALAAYTGVLRGLEALPRSRGLVVLNYHRVGDPACNAYDDGTFSATAAMLRAQVSYLRRRFDMPPVANILRSLRSGRFEHPTALLTFDDGYRDNYEIAYPV